MKFGVREICDVVLKAKANQKVGNKIFYKNEPVIYFDTLKTSSMEGAATTVYAQGGRGNTRLVAWEGERTVTFTMEDALISPAGFMILSGAGLIEATEKETIKVHATEQTDDVTVGKNDGNKTTVKIVLSEVPYWAEVVDYVNAKNTAAVDDKTPEPEIPVGMNIEVDTDDEGVSSAVSCEIFGNYQGENWIYVMLLDNGEVVSEPYIPRKIDFLTKTIELEISDDLDKGSSDAWPTHGFMNNNAVLVDHYVERKSGAQQIEITPDKFGGNYYLEASTLFRDTNGVDLPAEFIIPNCKIQSNFNFSMASTGDPSTFTFTMDAFPDYTRFDKTKKVLAAIQIMSATTTEDENRRDRTRTNYDMNSVGQLEKVRDKESREPKTEGNA